MYFVISPRTKIIDKILNNSIRLFGEFVTLRKGSEDPSGRPILALYWSSEGPICFLSCDEKKEGKIYVFEIEVTIIKISMRFWCVLLLYLMGGRPSYTLF